MGRWSQYRHRGRGGSAPAVPGFPLSAPVSGNWEFTQLDTDLAASMLAGCPLGADGVHSQVRQHPASAWVDSTALGCGDTEPVVTDVTPGTTWDARIAWALADVQVSDWSALKSATAV